MSSCCSQLHMVHALVRDPNSFTCTIFPANIMLSHVNTTKSPAPSFRSSPFCFLSSDISLESSSSGSCLLTSLSSESSCSVFCLISLFTVLLLFPVSSICSQSSCCFLSHLSVHNPPVVSCLIPLFTIPLFLSPLSQPTFNTRCSHHEGRTIER